MFKIDILALLLAFAVLGCGTGMNSDNQTVSGGQVGVLETEAAQSPSGLPVALSMTGAVDGDAVDVTIRIAYAVSVKSDTHLTIVPGNGTTILAGDLDSTFESPSAPGEIVRKVRIGGKEPSIRASAVVRGPGIMAETHGTYPPERTVLKQRNEAEMVPMPAPIEVEGAVVDHGVEVRP